MDLLPILCRAPVAHAHIRRVPYQGDVVAVDESCNRCVSGNSIQMDDVGSVVGRLADHGGVLSTGGCSMSRREVVEEDNGGSQVVEALLENTEGSRGVQHGMGLSGSDEEEVPWDAHAMAAVGHRRTDTEVDEEKVAHKLSWTRILDQETIEGAVVVGPILVR